jgi:hypothetical protein
LVPLLLFTQLKPSVPPTCRFWMPSRVNQVGLMFAIQLAWLSCSVGAGLMMVVEASCASEAASGRVSDRIVELNQL